MITTAIAILAIAADANLKVRDLVYASEERLAKVVGPRTSPPREPGIRFAHPGYYEVWVDSPGPGMKHLRMGLGSMVTWQKYLSLLGAGTAHASVHPQPVATSPIPLFRNKLEITGVTGLPVDKSKRAWKASFVEYAVANKKRLKGLKSQITAQPVGEGRNALIRSCYDWWAELDFTSP